MPRARIDLINWRPDLDEVGNDGLSKADNVIHDVEGWKPAHLASSGAFSTTLAATENTVLSIVAKPVGASTDVFCAWLADATASTLHVGINGATATNTNTGYPLQFTTTAVNTAIWAFDVCEYAGKIVWTVEARGEDAGGTTLSIGFSGYMDYLSGNKSIYIPAPATVTTSGLAPEPSVA